MRPGIVCILVPIAAVVASSCSADGGSADATGADPASAAAAGGTFATLPTGGAGASGLPGAGASSGGGGSTAAAGAAAGGSGGAASAGNGSTAGAAAPGAGSGGSDPPMECTDLPPPDQQPTCAQWAEWAVCDQDWFLSYCNASCGRCDDPNAAGAGGSSGAGGASGAGSGGAGSSGAGGSGDSTYPPIVNGCRGYATRYWDCCKPHCGWSANVPSGTAPLSACNQSDGSLGGDYNAANSCTGGSAFMCHGLAPWAVNDRLAYGFAAVAGRGDICGRCYQLQFTGSSHNAGADPGSAAIAGKTMIVQATNVGGDVGSGQFDILTPGGGVGTFNACSTQWGVPASQLGAQYGGLLSRCKEQNGADHAALKQCVAQSCASVFEARGLSELAAGCRWFVDWFQVADNPALEYREIACPSELTGPGMDRNSGAGSGCGI